MSQPISLDTAAQPSGTQAKLRDQLESLRIQMLEVSEQLNALSLPAKLPPEILLEIFLTHAARVQKNQLDRVLSDGKRVGKVSSYYQWIHVAHVCRRWREVALSCIEFKAYHVFETWTVPYYTLFWGVDTRALDDIPHSIVYHQNTTDRCQRCVPRSLSELGLDHIDEFLPRIKHLAIIIEDDEGTQALWESLGVAAETLESLRIGLRGSSWVYHTKEFESRFTIPDRLFTSCTPRLRTLTMSYVSFSWSNTLLCSSLQHLEITGHPGHEPTTDMATFIATLSRLTSLETLVMDCAPVIGQPFGFVAYLQRLRLLQLSTTLDQAAMLVAHLHLPPFTTITIRFSKQTHHISLEALSSFSQSLSRLTKDTPLRSMSWNVPPRGMALFVGLSESHRPSSIRAWTNTKVDLEQLWAPRSDVYPRLTIAEETDAIVPALLPFLRLPALTALQIIGPIPSNEEWSRKFVGAPNVSLLQVVGRVGYRLGRSLSTNILPPDAQTSTGVGAASSVAMPHLRAIRYFQVRFPPPRAPSDFRKLCASKSAEYCCDSAEFVDGRWGPRGIDLQDLVRGLRMRRTLGADPIERVEFLECAHMKLSHMEPLLREDLTVVFDGVSLAEKSS
ncbi:hypothetical protein ONZ51_g11477 [Trametes cubensis]|uniref:F-box domain-containing protein n=1 Tax=Trametes cubensis TaxID=1111947 RepID=A0AAD7X427_9APHY|nr:hypothetical protein ONZ51_g11477 [Trametes cubensis]